MYQMLELDEWGLVHGFSMANGGNMSFRHNDGNGEVVVENREKFLEKLGVSPDACVAMQTNDKKNIRLINQYSRGRGIRDSEGAIRADCLVTEEKGVFLWLVVADCLPAIFYCRKPFFLALAHISRKNSALGLSTKIVEFLRRLRVKPEELLVAIGPSIKKESYLFEPRYLPEAEKQEWRPFIQETKGLLSVDLLGFNVSQLKSAGVLEKNIVVDSFDTARSKMFFSHYRSKRDGLPEARFAAVVGVKN